jgi:hypothetical protein
MSITDNISESLETIFWVQLLKFDADPGFRNLFDPGSGIRDGKIRSEIGDKHPGSATLSVMRTSNTNS